MESDNNSYNTSRDARPCPRKVTLAQLEALVSRLILVPSPLPKEKEIVNINENKENNDGTATIQRSSSFSPSSSPSKIKKYRKETSTLVPVPPTQHHISGSSKRNDKASIRHIKIPAREEASFFFVPSLGKNNNNNTVVRRRLPLSSSSSSLPSSSSASLTLSSPTHTGKNVTVALGRSNSSTVTPPPKKLQQNSPPSKTSSPSPVQQQSTKDHTKLHSFPSPASTRSSLSPASISTPPHKTKTNYTPCSPLISSVSSKSPRHSMGRPSSSVPIETNLENQLDNDMYDYDNHDKNIHGISDMQINTVRRSSSVALLQAQELLHHPIILPRSVTNSPFVPIVTTTTTRSSVSSFAASKVSSSHSSSKSASPSQVPVIRRYTPQPSTNFLMVSDEKDTGIEPQIELSLPQASSVSLDPEQSYTSSSVIPYDSKIGIPPRPPSVTRTSTNTSFVGTGKPLQLADLLNNHPPIFAFPQFSQRTYAKYRRNSLPSSILTGTPAILADTYQENQQQRSTPSSSSSHPFSPVSHRRNSNHNVHEYNSFVSRNVCTEMALSIVQQPLSLSSSSNFPTRLGELVIQATVQRLRRWIKAQIHEKNRAEANHAAATTLHLLHVKQRVFTRLYKRVLLRHKAKLFAEARNRVQLSQAWNTWKTFYGIQQAIQRLLHGRNQRTMHTVFQGWKKRTKQFSTLRERTIAFHCYRLSCSLAKWRNSVFQSQVIEKRGRLARLRRMWIPWKALLDHHHRALIAADRYHLLRLQETRLPRIFLHWRIWVTRNKYIRNAIIDYGRNRKVKALHRWYDFVDERNRRIERFRTVISRKYRLARILLIWRTFMDKQIRTRVAIDEISKRQSVSGLHKAWFIWRNLMIVRQQKRHAENQSQACRLLLRYFHRTQMHTSFLRWKNFTLTSRAYEEKCVSQLRLRKGLRIFQNYRLQQRWNRLQHTRAIVHRGFVLVVKIMRKLHVYAQQQKELRKRLTVFLHSSLPRIQRRSIIHQWSIRTQEIRRYEKGAKILQRLGKRLRTNDAFFKWFHITTQERQQKKQLFTLLGNYRRQQLQITLHHWYQQTKTLRTAENQEAQAVQLYRYHSKQRFFRRWKDYTCLNLRLYRIGNSIERSRTLRIARQSWNHWVTQTREKLTEQDQNNRADSLYTRNRLRLGVLAWWKFTRIRQTERKQIYQAVCFRTQYSLRSCLLQWKRWMQQQRLHHEYDKLANNYYRNHYLENYFRLWITTTRNVRQSRLIRQQQEHQAKLEFLTRVFTHWRSWMLQCRKRKRTSISTILTVLGPFAVRLSFQRWHTNVQEIKQEEVYHTKADEYRRRRYLRYAVALWRRYPSDCRKERFQLAAAQHCYYRTLCTRIFHAWRNEWKELVKYRRLSSRLTRWLLTTVFEKLKVYTRTRKAKRRQIQFLSMAIVEGNSRIYSWCSVPVSLLYRFQTLQRLSTDDANNRTIATVHDHSSVALVSTKPYKYYDIFVEPPVKNYYVASNPIVRPLTYLGQQTVHRSILFRIFLAWRQYTNQMKIQDQIAQAEEDNDPAQRLVNQTAEELAIIHWESMKIRQTLLTWRLYQRKQRSIKIANELAYSFRSLHQLEHFFTMWKEQHKINKISIQLSTHLLMNRRMARCLHSWSQLTRQRQEEASVGPLRFWFYRWKLRHRARQLLELWMQKSLAARGPNAENVMLEKSDQYLIGYLVNRTLRSIRHIKKGHHENENWDRNPRITTTTVGTTFVDDEQSLPDVSSVSTMVRSTVVGSRKSQSSKVGSSVVDSIDDNYNSRIYYPPFRSIDTTTITSSSSTTSGSLTTPSNKDTFMNTAKRTRAKLQFQALLATVPTPETPEDRTLNNHHSNSLNNKENTAELSSSSPNLRIPFRPEETSLYRLYNNSPTLMLENEE